ncbi:CBS domain-containing protein [Clostridium sp.]|uniref:CBS domain-containing protein n=1 Tax=Clostridium sp. TaxID=1506 RepID=UPI002FC8BAFA
MKINDAMTKDVIKINADANVKEAARIMKEHNIGSIPVCEGNSVVGIVTDRDIVVRGIADNANENLSVRDVMTSNPVMCSSEKDISEAERIMSERQIRRLVVMDNENLVGMISLGDLAVENVSKNDIGETLKEISTPCCPN